MIESMSGDGHRGYVVKLDSVTCRVSKGSRYSILDEVTCTFHPGTFTAIVGENGAGKSSLLRLISGELRPDFGEVLVAGEPVDRPINQVIDGVGIVHQVEPADLIDHLTIGQNIAIRQILGGGHNGVFVNTNKWKRGVAAALGREGELTQKFALDKPVSQLSGGERQILSVSIAIDLEHRNNPCRLLLLDEHTSKLDHRNADDVLEYTVDGIRRSSATSIMVTHRYSEALRHADRIIVVRSGKIRCDFDRGEIRGLSELQLRKAVDGG